MKLTMIRIPDTEKEEVTIRYHVMSEQITAIAGIAQGAEPRILADWEGKTILVLPEQIFYVENIDGETWIYLADRVAKVPESLRELAFSYGNRGFFRCSKSMILNIYKIDYLKSEPGNRIRATLENGEQVIISRKYARHLRQILKGGRDEDEE